MVAVVASRVKGDLSAFQASSPVDSSGVYVCVCVLRVCCLRRYAGIVALLETGYRLPFEDQSSSSSSSSSMVGVADEVPSALLRLARLAPASRRPELHRRVLLLFSQLGLAIHRTSLQRGTQLTAMAGHLGVYVCVCVCVCV